MIKMGGALQKWSRRVLENVEAEDPADAGKLAGLVREPGGLNIQPILYQNWHT